MIARAKAHEEMMDTKALDDFVKQLNKTELPKAGKREPKNPDAIASGFLELLSGFGPETSCLPSMCSTS